MDVPIPTGSRLHVYWPWATVPDISVELRADPQVPTPDNLFRMRLVSLESPWVHVKNCHFSFPSGPRKHCRCSFKKNSIIGSYVTQLTPRGSSQPWLDTAERNTLIWKWFPADTSENCSNYSGDFLICQLFIERLSVKLHYKRKCLIISWLFLHKTIFIIVFWAFATDVTSRFRISWSTKIDDAMMHLSEVFESLESHRMTSQQWSTSQCSSNPKP